MVKKKRTINDVEMDVIEVENGKKKRRTSNTVFSLSFSLSFSLVLPVFVFKREEENDGTETEEKQTFFFLFFVDFFFFSKRNDKLPKSSSQKFDSKNLKISSLSCCLKNTNFFVYKKSKETNRGFL